MVPVNGMYIQFFVNGESTLSKSVSEGSSLALELAINDAPPETTLSVSCTSSNGAVMQLACLASGTAYSNKCKIPQANTGERLLAFFPYDLDNAPAVMPHAVLSCTVGTVSAALHLEIENVVRPIFATVSALEHGANATERQNVLDADGGTFEVVTSKGVDIEFGRLQGSHGPMFFAPSVTLINVQSGVHHEVNSESITSSLTSLRVALPGFQEVCNRSSCFFALEITNTAASSDGSAGAINCPMVYGQGKCFGPVSATRTPSLSGKHKWHTFRYVEKCVGAYAEPFSPVCKVMQTARSCAFGSGSACKRCPVGAHCKEFGLRVCVGLHEKRCSCVYIFRSWRV
jgi:hypothetical protein